VRNKFFISTLEYFGFLIFIDGKVRQINTKIGLKLGALKSLWDKALPKLEVLKKNKVN